MMVDRSRPDSMDKTTGIPFDPESGRASHLSFPVVGIGASAGGLVALKRFFEHLPAETGMAFVIVLHLSPKHESTADQILARCTRMPVLQVRERVPIEPNHVYVISPQNDLRMDDGQLAVAPSQRPRGQHVAIDLFFRTLGEVHGDRAIAVVLSGTGADGSVGITRVKEHGGVTLAQSPEDCEYEDMPRNAITTGRVDFVLPAADLPQKLIDLWKNAQRIELPPAPEAHGHIAPTPPDTRPDTEQALRDILDMLAARSGHDFRHYKRATVLRRIERRLQVSMLPDLPAYRDFLRANPEETARLLDDMLISVTNFFRDREAFEALEREVIPALFAEHVADEQVRVWVPACATGEEAYSVAMLLADHAATMAAPPGFQVFASDIDERGLSVGRAGSYPESIITDVPPSRLRQFFNKEQQRYRITKAIRDHVLFAQHNVLRDPPFSKLDMVCCRNLLIYLDREIQARLLEVFHFALRPGGLLFLGSSESADAASRHFDVVDKKHRIYRARNLAHSLPATVLPLRAAERRHAPLGTPAPARERRGFSFAEVHQRVLEHYAPPSVIVDRELNIVHMSDRAGRFLHFVGGEPSHNLLTVVHPELRLELRTALFQAVHTGKSVEARRVKIDRGGKPFFVNMVARPFRDPEAGAEFVLVLFDEVEDTMSADAGVASGERDAVMLHLEEELHRTKERLQATIEQSETSNEELKASNEELQAINEELRSATEELETSKEELQSVNEELITVNYELKTKVEETAKVNDDLRNFIASTDIATVFVDAGLRIRRYTPRAEDIFNIIPGDVGRCLLDITHRLDYSELAADATSAFEVLRPVEREVRSLDGRLFAARALPYRTQENRIDGAVLTFVDITRLRMAQERVDVAEDQLRVAATHAASHAMLVFDADGRITAWNAGAEQMFGYGVAEMNGQPVARLASPDDDGAERMRLQMREADRAGHAEAEYWCLRKDGSRVFCNSLLTPLQNGGFDGYIQVLADASSRVADVERTHAQLTSALSQRAKAEAESALKDDFLAVMSHELKNPLNLISVNTELVARTPEVRDSELVQQSLDGIRRAIRGQTKIIDDLLDMSRIRTGKLKLSVTAVDLGALVESIVEVARADVSSAAVDIGCTLGDTPSLVHADPLRLEQIIWNLLGNAIKFTPAGGQVRIAVQAEDRFCRLTVRDTGQGIEPYFLPRLFEMFSQVPGRALSGKSGLGIGLAVVREIVTLHGGRIEAASDGPGQGSTFTVWLPRVMPVVSRARKALPAPHENPWDGLQLLVVDDTAATVDGLARLLEMEGATVLRAYGGEEALDLLRRETVDVVLSDLGMPGIDGYELARRVRADPRTATLPMVALTGFAREGDVRESVAAGFTAHVGKPIVLESLAEVVAQALKATTQDD
jgi:two-component system CheB/CheR fusion protein